MWVSDANERPSEMTQALERYSRTTTPGLWHVGQFVQRGQGHQDMTMQRLISKLNWRAVRGRLSAMDWPQQQESRKLCYLLESFTQVGLFHRTGWGHGIPALVGQDQEYVWGGGLAVRDWSDMTYRVLTFQSALFEKMIRGGCDRDFVYTPVQALPPFQTTEDAFIYGEEGVTDTDFRAGASGHPGPPGHIQGSTTSGGHDPYGDAAVGRNGPGSAEKNVAGGSGSGSMVTQHGAGTGMVRVGGTTSAAGAGTPREAGMMDTAQDTSERRKRNMERVELNAGVIPKVGTDAASAAMNIDHRQPLIPLHNRRIKRRRSPQTPHG